MALPKNFIDLAAAYEAKIDSLVNVIGVVVDYMPPMNSRGTSYTLTFKLLDRRMHETVYGSQGLKFRFFRQSESMLPKVREVGDIVLIRKIKMSTFQQQPIGLSNNLTEVTVFPVASIPEPGFQIAYQGDKRLHCLGVEMDTRKLSLDEQAYVIHLKQDLKSVVQSFPKSAVLTPRLSERQQPPANAPTGPAFERKRPGGHLASDGPPKVARYSKFGPKFQLIRELEHRKFADICALVVKKFPSHYGCDLYVTDHTEHKGMFYYTPPEEENEVEKEGDRFGHIPQKREWPGPYGWLVLKVTLVDPHAYFANREVNEGDFVLLRNVKIKYTSETKLQGDMWPDQMDPEKLQIRKITDLDSPEIMEIEERRDKYWTARNAKNAPKKGPPEKATFTGRKKRRKEERDRIAAKKFANVEDNAKIDEAMRDVQAITLNGTSKKDTTNPHIRCSNQDVPCVTIKGILDPGNAQHMNTTPEGKQYIMPFICARYRAKVRVVDFSPRKLEEFAVPELTDADDDGDRSPNSPVMDWDSSPKYEWSFLLLLEDASRQKSANEAENRVWVNVGHQEAQHLFGNDVEDPTDLRNDARLLARLREKLCILWGNVEEKYESEQTSNVPFECCLYEYGVELDDDDLEKDASLFGMKRMYRMFGVTIL